MAPSIPVTCLECEGQGEIDIGRAPWITETCPNCKGTGYEPDEAFDHIEEMNQEAAQAAEDDHE